MANIVYILNGPNLNLLGEREPEIYGRTTLAQIEESCTQLAQKLGFSLVFRQSNHEGQLVDWLQEARSNACGVIVNAAALTHTSVALRDAAASLPCPLIELHISNVHKREAFRQHSYLSQVAAAVLCGFGAAGYALALQGLWDMIQRSKGASGC